MVILSSNLLRRAKLSFEAPPPDPGSLLLPMSLIIPPCAKLSLTAKEASSKNKILCEKSFSCILIEALY